MIKKIKARKILDSRKNPTVEVKLITNKGKFKASVPSGASTGRYEAKALEASEAVKNVNKIIGPAIAGRDSINQEEIDRLMIELDGTNNKSKLGANAILAVSMAVCRAGASPQDIPLYQYLSNLCNKTRGDRVSPRLPRPCFNIINGGAHSDNELDIQEFMVIPDEDSFSKNLEAGKEIYKNLRNILKKEFGRKGIRIGDEGGFSPPISKTKEALDFLLEAIGNYHQTKIGLDCAASRFFENGIYNLEKERLNSQDLLYFYKELIERYPIISIEDAFAEEDWDSWQTANNQPQIANNVILIGDDLTVTNKSRLEKAVDQDCISGIIIKPNQIGTITETLETARIAKDNDLKIMVSHRSGETKDDFIADLAIGINADFIKSGAPNPKERMTKYNRLLFIEQGLNK